MQAMLADVPKNGVDRFFDYRNCKWIHTTLPHYRHMLRSLLHAEKEKKLFRMACILGRVNWVETSIDDGHFSDYDEEDGDGLTPIMHSCMHGHYEAVRVAMIRRRYRVRVNVHDVNGMSCFKFALCSSDANRIVRLLFRAGLSVVSEDELDIKRCISGNRSCNKVDMENLLYAAGFFPRSALQYAIALDDEKVPSLSSICLQVVRETLMKQPDPNIFVALKPMSIPNNLKRFICFSVSILNLGEVDNEWW